jgi:alginate O-acetyltransferase complex protein AlgI
MVFSSVTFLLYFLPVFILVYSILPKSLKNWFILLASISFYSWGAPQFVYILLGSTFVDFFIVKGIHDSNNQRRRKLLLILSLFMNLGLLAFFKYANFFVENVNAALESIGAENIAWTQIALPIGISFYTFQTLTYSIDVYRNTHAPFKKVHNYFVYIMSFPQMIAGPIVRFNEIAGQIVERKETIDDKLFGFYRFTIGLAKKVLVANVLGEYADSVMSIDSEGLTTGVAWLGILAYTFQIYFDFAGYSDMAIGLGRIMGLRFPENFDNPYTSKSITEFWRRWHITLGNWMKNYLYIPLGGNKVNSNFRLYFNLWFVFLISGLWHGASWNFVVWGAYHGLFLILERLFLKSILEKIGSIPSVIFTFLVVVVGWVFFSLDSFSDASEYISVLFRFDFNLSSIHVEAEIWTTFIIATLVSFSCLTSFGKRIQHQIYFSDIISNRRAILISIVSVLFFFICTAYVTSADFNPFIYFRF